MSLVMQSTERSVQMSVFDYNRPNAKYLSFSSGDNGYALFLYECQKKKEIEMDLHSSDVTELKEKCKYLQAYSDSYEDFHKLSEVNGIRNLTVFMRCEKTANILFTVGTNEDRLYNNVYELSK